MSGIVLLALSLSLVLESSAAPPTTKPNIVFVLVDDWGFADVGFRNPNIKTPNFDMLAHTGLILNRHYVFKYCSPSRVSLLTGRWPHHAHQWNPPSATLAGANLNMTMLPAKLKQAGYATHMVGKWHEGLYTPEYLPVNRGFDTSSGFLQGGEDHFTQKVGCAVDYWKNNAFDPRNGSYDAYNYRDDLRYIFSNHDPSKPLFLYLPLHNVHGPFEAPQEWLNLYPENSTCSKRRVYQAMASVADNVTGLVVELLKEKSMWNNTIFVVSSDNGGAPCGGSNYPLRGSKMSFFEGGVRVLAFANGGLLPDNMRGKTTEGFIHIADWYTTFCKQAGVDPSDSGPGKFPVDGLDVWPILTGKNSSTPHHEIVLGYNFTDRGAIIVGNYKLIVGTQESGCDTNMYSPLNYPCQDGPSGGRDCDPYCLFNIVEDPEERNDLSSNLPDVLKDMVAHYQQYAKEPRDMQDQGYHTVASLPQDPNACQYMKEHGEYWQPWKQLQN